MIQIFDILNPLRADARPVPCCASRPLLDLYPADSAHSLRLISSTYAGNCIRVRRASDNQEQDIGFSVGIVDVAAIAAFCGASIGYIVTWYDQSGNGNDWTQTTAASQARIYDGASIDTINGKPAANYTFRESFPMAGFDGNERMDHYKVFSTTDDTYRIEFGQSTAYTSPFAQDGNNGTVIDADYGSPSYYLNGSLQSWGTNNEVHDALSTGNQALLTTINCNTSTWTTSNLGGATGSFFVGYFQELIQYNSESNQAAIEAEVTSYYGIS